MFPSSLSPSLSFPLAVGSASKLVSHKESIFCSAHTHTHTYSNECHHHHHNLDNYEQIPIDNLINMSLLQQVFGGVNL